MKMKDVELIQQILDGDHAAFTTLVEKYQKGLHALIWQKIGDFHIAQEITQDAFLKAYQRLETLKDHKMFSGWLYVIATRLCTDWLRKNHLPIQSLETVDTKEVDQVSYNQYVEEQRKIDEDESRRLLVRKLLNKLPESERTVMTLHYLGEMTCESISKFLGVSQNTIKSRLNRARNRLKKDENLIIENLSSFKLPTHMTNNIMKKVKNQIPPTPPVGSKPLIPLAISSISVVLVLLLMGIGSQQLHQFQQPYNLTGSSKNTIEIVDAQIVLDLPSEPVVKKLFGGFDVTAQNNGKNENTDVVDDTTQDNKDKMTHSDSQWIQTKGPEGGSVSDLFISTLGDIYAGTHNHLYRLSDDGDRWIHVYEFNDPFKTSNENPMKWWPITEHNDKLFLATNNEILTSLDRGETWKKLCSHPKGFPVDIEIHNRISETEAEIVIYLALPDRIIRTIDLGNTWTPLREGIIDKKIRSIATVENTILAGTDQGLYSLNEKKWESITFDNTEMGNNTRSILDLTVSGSRIYVAVGNVVTEKYLHNYSVTTLSVSGCSFYRSIDGGISWNLIQPKESLWIDRYRNTHSNIQIGAAGKKVIIVQGMDYFYSVNEGEDWTYDTGNHKHFFNPTDVVILNTDTFFKCGIHGIHRTTDSGKSWHKFNYGLVGTHISNLASIENTIYAYGDTGLYASNDKGELWTSILSTANLKSIIYGSDGELYRLDARRKLMKFSSQKKNFVIVPGIPELQINENNILRLPLNNNPHNLQESNYDWIELVPTNQVKGIAVSNGTIYIESNESLYRWKPGTSKWYDTKILDGKNSFEITDADELVFFSNNKFAVIDNNVYVGKRNGHLMQSIDEGETWKDITDNLPWLVDKFKTITTLGNTIYVSTDKGVVLSKNGNDWDILMDADGIPIVVDKLTAEGTRLFGLVGKKVYLIEENLRVWKQVTPEIPYDVTSLEVDENTIYVGTQGSGVFRFTLDD